MFPKRDSTRDKKNEREKPSETLKGTLIFPLVQHSSQIIRYQSVRNFFNQLHGYQRGKTKVELNMYHKTFNKVKQTTLKKD